MPTKKKTYSSARKSSKVPTRNFVYGVGCKGEQPTPQDVIRDQLWEAHQYKVALIRNGLARIDAENAILCEVSPRLGELQRQSDDLTEKIKTMRAELKSPREDRADSPESAAIQAVVDERKAVYEEMKKVRKDLFALTSTYNADLNRKLEQGLLELAVEKDPAFAPLLDGCPEGENPKEFKKRVKRATSIIGPRNPKRVALNARLTEQMLSDDSVPDTWKRIKEVQQECHKKNLQARKDSKCFSGTYQAVDAAVRDAFQKSYHPRVPKFNRTGKVGIQLTGERTVNGKTVKGLPVSEVFSPDNQFSLELLPDHRVYGARKKHNRKEYPVMARARICVARGVRVETLVVMHRPLPEDGVIKWAYLEVKRVGLKTRYELRLVIEYFPKPRPKVTKKPLLAVNFGYRAMADGTIRLATTWDGEEVGGITLPSHIKRDEEFSRRLDGHADKRFNTAQKELGSWKKTVKDMPDELKEKIRNSGQWRAHGKLAVATHLLVRTYVPESETTVRRLWHTWRVERLEQGLDLFDERPFLENWFREQGVRSRNARFALYMEWWRRKDVHLVDLAKGFKARYKRRIKEIVRVQVARWRDSYEVIASNEWDMRKTARKPKPENDTRTKREINANGVRQIGGPGIVNLYLKEVFGDRRMTTDSKGASKIHFGCGGEGTGIETDLRCNKCGRGFDQDINAARHTWKEANGTLNGTPPKKAPKRKRSSRLAETTSSV